MLSSLPTGYQSRSINGIAAKSPTGKHTGSAAGFAKSFAVRYQIVRGALRGMETATDSIARGSTEMTSLTGKSMGDP